MPKQINVGVRYDFEGPGQPKFLNKHGIDTFSITGEIMAVMEDHGFVIGIPVWDSWIVWHMLTHRFKTRAKLTPGLLHLTHPLGWSDQDLAKGLAIMQREYGIGHKGLSAAISDVTGKPQVRKVSRNTPTRSFSSPR